MLHIRAHIRGLLYTRTKQHHFQCFYQMMHFIDEPWMNSAEDVCLIFRCYEYFFRIVNTLSLCIRKFRNHFLRFWFTYVPARFFLISFPSRMRDVKVNIFLDVYERVPVRAPIMTMKVVSIRIPKPLVAWPCFDNLVILTKSKVTCSSILFFFVGSSPLLVR